MKRYTIRGYAGRNHQGGVPAGTLLLETKHTTEESRDIEISAYRTRGARGEISFIEVLDHDNAKTRTIYF